MDAAATLSTGRDAYERQSWADAYGLLARADRETELGADDLHRLGMAAMLAGRDDEMVQAWERAHHTLIGEGRAAEAVRVAFWLGMTLHLYGQHARGGGWLERARQVLDDHELDVVERGYLLVPVARQQVESDPEQALRVFREATGIADEHQDPDGRALGESGQGLALVELGRVSEGVAKLDAAMVEVTSADVSPIAAGLVYCAVLIICRMVFDFERAREWTDALSGWCERQGGLQPFRGQCLVHRSEIKQLHGDWAGALGEIENACTHLSRRPNDPVMGMARYQQAELLRMRGEFDQAEDAYRQAGGWGHPVHPGLALLRLAQGRLDDARAAITRVLEEAESSAVRRSQVLAAHVQIMLADGDIPAAADGTADLERIAEEFGAPYLHAVAATERGSVLLAEGDAAGASRQLRQALELWQDVRAPFEAARARVRLAEAFHRLGDHDTAGLELEAARRVFEEVGAAPSLADLELRGAVPTADAAPGGLTPREVEVIRLVATGATNREVADELVISDKTVGRHLSNIFTKLGVSSRSAATAWAFEHGVA